MEGVGWMAGVVSDLLYREESMPPGLVASYGVIFDDSRFTYVPDDEDDIIRKEHAEQFRTQARTQRASRIRKRGRWGSSEASV